jgi:DNA-binding HxlR family transcriptional regulator
MKSKLGEGSLIMVTKLETGTKTKLEKLEKISKPENDKDINELDIHLCPKYEKAIAILGKRWTGLIIAALMFGPRRFNELLKIVQRVAADKNTPDNKAGTKLISDRLLTERMVELAREGIVCRTVYPESPVRIEYSLTAKGQAMRQVYESIQHWADEWVSLEHIVEEVSKAEAK